MLRLVKPVQQMAELLMSNPNPRIENLELGRGQKPKLGHQSYKFNIRL